MCCIYCTSRTVPFHTVNTLTEWNTPTELFGTRFKRLICIENSTRIPATFSHCFEQSLPYSYMSLLWQDMPLCYVFCLGYLNSESPIGTHRIRHADETRTRSKDAIKIPNRLPFWCLTRPHLRGVCLIRTSNFSCGCTMNYSPHPDPVHTGAEHAIDASAAFLNDTLLRGRQETRGIYNAIEMGFEHNKSGIGIITWRTRDGGRSVGQYLDPLYHFSETKRAAESTGARSN